MVLKRLSQNNLTHEYKLYFIFINILYLFILYLKNMKYYKKILIIQNIRLGKSNKAPILIGGVFIVISLLFFCTKSTFF